ncbi:hypothetical protein [Flavobacterium denitrificans]|uniref:hypothetical protein n=1 Tax=Flavobacterium denitrificans TaxID=281361 RepID=UPI0003FC23D1|nr:hypothetical protein [Flavobacterium denitrificans]
MAKISLKVFYAKGIRVTIKNKDFKEAMRLIWTSPEFNQHEPLKMVFESTGKILYMDKPAFMQFLDGNLTQKELIELTECDDLYRNTANLVINGAEIDSGSLWKVTNAEAVLVSDDDYITKQLDLNIFEIAE